VHIGGVGVVAICGGGGAWWCGGRCARQVWCVEGGS
jgi:hypothetical protein